MKRWLLRRLLVAIPTLLGITIVTFVLSRLAPGGPLSDLLDSSEGGVVSAAQVAETERLLGLDRPLPEQYLQWLSRSIRFDFGESLTSDRRPVSEKIADAAWVSLPLQVTAVVLIYAIGIPLGLWCAARAGRRAERWIGSALFLLHSMPMLLIGTLLIALFCGGLFGNLPFTGSATPGLEGVGVVERFLDQLRHALLPVACLVLAGLAGVTRYARAGVLEALRQPFIVAARARGLPERLVLGRHALKNGILPVVALLSGLLPWLVTGSVTVETLFAIPGLGRLTIESALARDYPTMMALAVLVGVSTLVGFLLSDLAHVALRRRSELG